MSKLDVQKAASELSQLGAAKGGKARASVLSPEERSDISRQAVIARWKKEKGEDYEPPEVKPQLHDQKTQDMETIQATTQATAIPYSMFRGKISIGNVELECHVLNDLRRVMTQREMVRMLTGRTEGSHLGRYLDNNPLTSNMLTGGMKIEFKIPGQGASDTAFGYEAPLLVDICTKYLEAREQGILGTRQRHIAIRSEILLRACAKVGIIALIDEATGYQKERQKRALQLKLQAFIAEDLQEWAKMFPDEFWLELARLEGIHYSPRNRPLRWGKYVMHFVYDAIDPDIGNKLRDINPNPHFKQNHHQWLQKFGREKVNDQIQRVIGTMQACKTIEDFKKKFEKILGRNLQLDFDFMED